MLLIVVFLVLVYSLFKEFEQINQGDGNEVISLIATAVIMILTYSLIFALKLKTRIDEKVLRINSHQFILNLKGSHGKIYQSVM